MTFDLRCVSGTDIRGLAQGSEALITEKLALSLGAALARYLKTQNQGEEGRLRVALGRDSRLSGPKLLKALAQGLCDQGVDVLDFGMCTTPSMYDCLLQEDLNLKASVMVTASHHPSNRNGFKFFLPDGGVSAETLNDILAQMEDEDPVKTERKGQVTAFDYLSLYMEHLSRVIYDQIDSKVQRPLLGLHVLVDAGNGAGGFFEKLLSDLGAWTEGSQFLDPDGHFPNHIPNPEDPEAIASLSKAVLRHGADLGVIFDTDCDRAALVDQDGKEINRNRLIALVSAVLLDKEPGLTVVTDSVTSTGLTKFIGDWGGEHYRYKRGYRNVIDEAKRLNEIGINCPLAIETSGHAAFRENHFLDDGMYLSAMMIGVAMRLKQEGKTLSSLLEGLREPVESCEIRLEILDKDFRKAGIELIQTVMDYASGNEGWHIAPDNREGVRIAFDLQNGQNNAWFLLRLSVHDPVMPLNFESDVEGGVKEMMTFLYEAIEDTETVDLSALKKAIKKA